MSIWYCVPSARPDGGTLREWHEKGYSIAVWRDPGSPSLPFLIGVPHYLIVMPYPGYAKSVNWLVNEAMVCDPSCEWFVTGGDDVSPDLAHSPEEIAESCTKEFWKRNLFAMSIERTDRLGTMGVMQPTGDRWGADEPWARKNWPQAPAYIDRICGSPWMGREFCRRANAGKGPLCEDYEHMYVDEHLQEYAKQLGILWQRPDLIQYHHHALRGGKPQSSLPPHLKCRYEGSHFKDAKAIFDRHMAAKFAGLEPIA